MELAVQKGNKGVTLRALMKMRTGREKKKKTEAGKRKNTLGSKLQHRERAGDTYEGHTSENPGHRSRPKLELGLWPTLRILELE